MEGKVERKRPLGAVARWSPRTTHLNGDDGKLKQDSCSQVCSPESQTLILLKVLPNAGDFRVETTQFITTRLPSTHHGMSRLQGPLEFGRSLLT